MTNKKLLAFTAMIALLVSLTGGFIVYAALTQQLKIEGNAEFVPETWDVKFKSGSLNSPILTGGASVTTAPYLTDTMISDYEVILTREGDSITYVFEIENTGSIDAKLTTLSLGTPSCTGTEGSTKTADEAIVCSSNLTYTLKYLSSDDNTTNGVTAGNNVTEGDNLKRNTTAKVELKLAFSSLATQLPANSVGISNLDSYLFYTAE